MKLTIDGTTVEARDGEMVLDCALRHQIEIPHLCALPELEPYGGCRLCLVEIEGVRGYPASCSTLAQDGMQVRTATPRLRELRQQVLGLLMTEHPSACFLCNRHELCERYRPLASKSGCGTCCNTCSAKVTCELRALTLSAELDELPSAPIWRGLQVDSSDPFIDRDLNLCILCGRCVRVCKKLHDDAVIDLMSRGSQSHIGTAFDRSLVDADCRFCGACIDVCPTGTLTDRYAKWHPAAKSAGATTCLLCDGGCAIEPVAERDRVVGCLPHDPAAPLCVVGRFGLAPLLNHQQRLSHPLARIDGALRRVSWQEALDRAAELLRSHRGDPFASICDTDSPIEERLVLARLCREALASSHHIELSTDSRGHTDLQLPAPVRSVVTTGDFLSQEQLDRLESLVVLDFYPGRHTQRADVVLPVAILAELEATSVDRTGARRPLNRVVAAPGEVRTTWQVVCDLAVALGADAIADPPATEAGDPPRACALKTGQEPTPPACHDVRVRRTHFRGHPLDEIIPELHRLPLSEQEP